MAEDPRNARRTDPWTSLAGTEAISASHKAILHAFLTERDRPEGWTSGELSTVTELAHSQAWRRISDLCRDGLAQPTGLTRVWPPTGRAQQAWRVALPWVPSFPGEVYVDWEHLAELAEQGMSAEVGPLIEALYAGRCRGCGGRWEPGDFIAWATGEDRYVCADCARG